MKAILDTCIIVDALQNRDPFSKDAHALFLSCANYQFEGILTAKSVTDIYYLMHRYTHNDSYTRNIISKLCTLFQLTDTIPMDIHNALDSEISDFEDAVMIETAIRIKADCIITRNIKDYKKANLPVYTPSEFIILLKNSD